MRSRLTLLVSAAVLAALLVPPRTSARSDVLSVRPAQEDRPHFQNEPFYFHRDRSDFDVRDESTISRTLRFDSSGKRELDVRAMHGSIRVIGADRSDVQLDVLRTVRANTDEDLIVADRDVTLDIVDAAPRIEAIVREKDGGVCGEFWNERGPWRRPQYVVTYDFAIEVPRDTRLRLCTIDGRELLVEGTTGAFELDNVNGRITMANVRGSGSARTVNGPIVARFAEQPRDPSAFRTVNGQVVIGFPAALDADLRMKTFNGGLFTDFDVQSLPQPVAVAERRGGGFVYRANQFTLVRAGRGGPELTFETHNGSVRVIRAER